MRVSKLKNKLVGFFMSKINIDFFSRLIYSLPPLRPLYRFAAQRLIDYKFPRHIFIEITSVCNLKCKMCSRNIKPISIGTMNFNLFKKIIDEASNYGERTFCLHLFGEPLCDPGFNEKIAYIKKINPKNSILLTTNGVLINEENARAMIESKMDKIFISLHSPDPETYQEITGKDCLAEVEKNIKKLVAMKKEFCAQKPAISLRFIKIKENIGQERDFKNKWNPYAVKIEIRDGHNYGGKILETLRPFPKKRHPCYHLWFSPGINWDGEMTICCDDVHREMTLGNVKEKTVSEIWQSEEMKRYRQYHLSGQYEKMPLCKNCDVWQIYPDLFFKFQKRNEL